MERKVKDLAAAYAKMETCRGEYGKKSKSLQEELEHVNAFLDKKYLDEFQDAAKKLEEANKEYINLVAKFNHCCPTKIA